MAGKGTQSGQLMDPDQNKDYNDPSLLAKVAENLRKAGGDPEPISEVKEEEELVTDDSVVDDETVNADDDTTDDDDELESDDDEDGTNDDTEDGPVIPEKLFRAAKHSEWSTEDITEFWKKNPVLAEKTFTKLHKDMVDTNNQYAEHGRAAKELERRKAELEGAPNASAPAAPAPKQPENFIDIQAFEEEYGSGAAAIVKQLNDALVTVVGNQRKQPQSTVANEVAAGRVEVAEREKSLALVQQMGQWFADPGLTTYEEFYGKGRGDDGFMLLTTQHLTEDQKKHRGELLDLAADIEAGVALRAGTISVADALSRAHILLTKDIQTANIRKDILSKATKRAKGVTLRPNGKSIKPQEKLKPGEKKSEKRLLSDTERRLAALRAGKPLS